MKSINHVNERNADIELVPILPMAHGGPPSAGDFHSVYRWAPQQMTDKRRKSVISSLRIDGAKWQINAENLSFLLFLKNNNWPPKILIIRFSVSKMEPKHEHANRFPRQYRTEHKRLSQKKRTIQYKLIYKGIAARSAEIFWNRRPLVSSLNCSRSHPETAENSSPLVKL